MSLIRKIRGWIFCNSFIRFIKNCWRFRKDLSTFREFDYKYNLDLFLTSLKITRDFMASDNVVSLDALTRSEEIQRFIDLIERHDKAIDIAGKELGYELSYDYSDITKDDREFIKKVESIEATSWNDAFNHLRDRLPYWWD